MELDLALIALLGDLAELDRTRARADRQRLISSALASLHLLERGGGGSFGLARVGSLKNTLEREQAELGGL